MCRSRLAKRSPRGVFGRHQLANCKNCETQELGEKLSSSEAFAEKCSLLVDTVIKYSDRGVGFYGDVRRVVSEHAEPRRHGYTQSAIAILAMQM